MLTRTRGQKMTEKASSRCVRPRGRKCKKRLMQGTPMEEQQEETFRSNAKNGGGRKEVEEETARRDDGEGAKPGNRNAVKRGGGSAPAPTDMKQHQQRTRGRLMDDRVNGLSNVRLGPRPLEHLRRQCYHCRTHPDTEVTL